MKRYRYLLAGIMLQLTGLLFFAAPKIAAAECENVSQYGAVRLQVPDLPYTGDYSLWVRLQSQQPETKLLIELNQSACYEIYNDSVKDGEWTWVKYSLNGKKSAIMLDQKKSYSIKLIGISQGLKIDSVIFSDTECILQGNGSNCSVAVQAENIKNSDFVELPPLSQNDLSGKVFLSNTPKLYEEKLESVSYIVNGRTLQYETSLEPFDTNLLEDGLHKVLITTRLNNGEVINESIDISVQNPNNALSPVVRWFRLRESSVKVTLIVIFSILLSLLTAWAI
ncbi:MAG: hypothetical protein M3Q36_02800, partial [bacterium]|nr:hypothetical protein [bacterium]